MHPSPYEDLEPSTWRGLLARAAVYHATRGALEHLAELAASDTAVGSVLLQLDRAATVCSDEDNDDVALVAAVAQRWEAEIERTLGEGHLEPATEELLMQLRCLVRAASGEDPFRTLFYGIERHARALYGAAWRPTALAVAHRRTHPREADLGRDPYALTAFTPWPPDPHQARVELRVFCDRFGPAAFAVLPILLIHEFVCHVPARQDKVNNDSEFAEGLLDWAAYYFHHQWASKVDRELAPAARTHADQLKSVLLTPKTAAARARKAGHAAAEKLVTWFEHDCGLSPEESRMRVAALAVALNQVERPLEIKDHFVSRIAYAVPPDLEEALRSWVANTAEPAQLLDAA